MSSNNNIKNDLKIIIIGSSGTGKTSLVKRWIGNAFESTKPTIISEFSTKIYKKGDIFYRAQLWDIGGQDKSPSMAKIFARDSHGCLVLSDCTKPESFQDTLDWKNVMNKESVFVDGEKLPFVLVQNKIDLIEEKKDLDEIENKTKELSEQNEFVKYYLTSVKENVNVEETMNYLIGNIIDRLEVYAKNGGEVFNDQRRRSNITLRETSSKGKDKKNSCC